MLDVTGIDALERPELAHLVTQVAGKISNALVLAQSHSVLLRLTWPGNTLGSDADGLVCLDKDGWITGANPVARQMVPGMSANQTQLVHAEEVFGLPLHMIFDATKERQKTLEIPLWNGLQLHGTAVLAAHENAPSQHITRPQELAGVGLKDMETHMIIQAVVHAKGNVALAAQALGISRATVYRKLGKESRR
jgi:transcriptional regulator of acetoin/glycerol metabolism